MQKMANLSNSTTAPHNKKNNYLLMLSYPGSGSHFLAYCLEEWFDIQMLRASRKKPQWLSNLLEKNMGVCMRESVFDSDKKKAKHKITKIHLCRDAHIKQFKEENDGIILLLRNPLESVPRNIHKRKPEALKADQDILKKMIGKSDNHAPTGELDVDYIRLLEAYRKFEGNKVAIYYEDLIENIPSEYEKLFKFFSNAGLSPDREIFTDFMANYEEHKERSFSVAYIRDNLTGGKKKNLIFWSELVDDETKRSYMKYLKDNFPESYNEHLVRYELPPA